jgi:hypothetical protein
MLGLVDGPSHLYARLTLEVRRRTGYAKERSSELLPSLIPGVGDSLSTLASLIKVQPSQAPISLSQKAWRGPGRASERTGESRQPFNKVSPYLLYACCPIPQSEDEAEARVAA